MEPVKLGVISTAKIGTTKVIPAMQKSTGCSVHAIASRNPDAAKTAADALGVPKAYGSYEDMLADPEIEAVYNPLPNHLHVPLSIKAAEAGKHVLCEKPISFNAQEARQLIDARDNHGVVIAEAFMVRYHPQWIKARELVRSGAIGEVRVVQGTFSYMNRDPSDVRNKADIGGGALYDIGCYTIVSSRYIFGQEPVRAVSLIERDPDFCTDRLASALLEFPSGQALFVCSTQLVPYQRVQIFGTNGRIEVQIPFNAPHEEGCVIFCDDGSAQGDASARKIAFDAVDQYTLQADAFARAVRGVEPLEFPIEDAVKNMAVIDAVFRSAQTGDWENVAT
ncbi:MAG: Gfo/Idh/MocA family oxidoreductase [Hyphomicrobiales bacterium]|nr:Gfo/Idh/MocA family oxidoreductase [Hyphomicrobiales bacterium]